VTRNRFKISPNDKLTLYYRDEENDRVIITYDDELDLSLNPNNLFNTFELVNVEQNEGTNEVEPINKIRYPDENLGTDVGDYYEVIFESKYLISANKKGTGLWGTKIYTSDSDYLKALLHSHSIKLTKIPLQHNIIATFKVLSGRTSYVGSNANGVKSCSYGNWSSSFTVEKYRYDT